MVLCFSSITIVIAFIRLVFNIFFSTRGKLQLADWIIVVGVPICLATISLASFILPVHGLGKDLWGLTSDTLVQFGLYFYVIQLLYVLVMTLIKLSLTFFYLEIFSSCSIRYLLYFTAAVHVAMGLTFIIAMALACMPVSYQWQKYDPTDMQQDEGRCININAGAWSNGVLTIVSDVWLLGLPLSQVKSLRLSWQKKVSTCLMFLTGAM